MIDDGLSEPLAELVGDDASEHIVAAAGAGRHNQMDRPVWIIGGARWRRKPCRQRQGDQNRAAGTATLTVVLASQSHYHIPPVVRSVRRDVVAGALARWHELS